MLSSSRGLVLRAIEESDLQFVCLVRNDPELEAAASREPPIPRSIEEFRKNLGSDATRRAPADGSADSLEFVCEVDGTRAGIGGLYSIDLYARHAEIGVTLAEGPWRGKGFGRLAHEMLLDYAFRWLNLRRVLAAVHSDNTRVIELCHELGFVDEGLRKEFRWVKGSYVDLLLLAVTRDAYASHER